MYKIKQYKRITAIALTLLLLCSVFILPGASAVSDVDYIDLPEMTLSNGDIGLWDNNQRGYLIPQGAKLAYQANAEPIATYQLLIYKKDASGEFVLHQSSFIETTGGMSFELDDGSVQETGFYAFGVQSYSLRDVDFTGIVYYL